MKKLNYEVLFLHTSTNSSLRVSAILMQLTFQVLLCKQQQMMMFSEDVFLVLCRERVME